jgi:L-serine deaminase
MITARLQHALPTTPDSVSRPDVAIAGQNMAGHLAVKQRAPSLFAESEQSVRDAARYQRPWRSYLPEVRAAQAFGPGAESSLALGASDLGATDLHIRLGHIENGDSAMKSAAMRFLAALGIASALVMSVTSVSFAQRNTSCIPHYDSSGAQTAPYC